jgi:ribosome-binding factor A
MLRGPVGRALRLRHSPHLRFVNDELIENGAKLSALIHKAVKEDEAKHVDDPDAPPATDDSER